MKNKINIAELLKDCPTGMELDCAMYDSVQFDIVQDGNAFPIKINTPEGRISLPKYGCYSLNSQCKCIIIFPKGKTTWEGFQRPFKDGDIVATTNGLFIGIVKVKNNMQVGAYCSIDSVKDFRINNNYVFDRLATTWEKQKLFDAIKENSYKWNEETKTLEKLVKPKFKDGDILFVKATYSWIIIYKESENEGELYKYAGIPDYPNNTFIVYDCNPLCCKDDISEIRFATEEEKEKLFDSIKDNGYKWNAETKTLEKLPKFKVGDRVRNKNYKDYIYFIHDITDKGYRAKEIDADSPIIILFGSQEDNYELAPNKFDITTLKPFDKVLVRNTDKDDWMISMFGYISKVDKQYFMCIANTGFYQCVPYNDKTKHLLGTTNNCEDFYKIWE